MHNWRVSYLIATGNLTSRAREESLTVVAPTAADALEIVRCKLTSKTMVNLGPLTPMSGARWSIADIEWLSETDLSNEPKEGT